MAKTIQINQISLVIPTLNRAENIRKTFDNLKDKGVKLWYTCHEFDEVSQEVVKELGVNLIIDTQPQTAINAMNAAYWYSDGEWVILSQDDIFFHDGAIQEAVRVAEMTGAKVIGFNDDSGSGRPEHSVCWLVHRPYIEKNSLAIGFPNVIFFPHYAKNWSDDELNEIARARGVWAYAQDARAEHLHPAFHKSMADETYRLNDDKLTKDQELYLSRKHLWDNGTI